LQQALPDAQWLSMNVRHAAQAEIKHDKQFLKQDVDNGMMKLMQVVIHH